MRIGLTSPFAHPYVRRGVERYVQDLAAWLASRGHAVTIVATSPDKSHVVVNEAGVVIRYRHPGRPFGRGRLRVDELLRSIPAMSRGIRQTRADVYQCHHYVDAAAIRVARAGGRRARYVLSVPGVPRVSSLGGRPLHRLAFRAAASGSSKIHALSRFAADALRDEFGLSAEVMPPGVDTLRFGGPKVSTEDPFVLCTAAADDPRKRVDL